MAFLPLLRYRAFADSNTRDDGKFQINPIQDRSETRTSFEELRVCQYCLGEIRYENFSHNLARGTRAKIVSAFTVRRFFELWPVALVDGTGLHEVHTLETTLRGINPGIQVLMAELYRGRVVLPQET